MFGNQYPNNTLGQSSMNPKGRTITNAPDTDSRLIKINGSATEVIPNLMHDHTRINFTATTGNTNTVNFRTPINAEEKSLHFLVLDNSKNPETSGGTANNKTFTFNGSYIFLDNVGTNSYTVNEGKVLVFYGVYENGKLKLRVSGESTN